MKLRLEGTAAEVAACAWRLTKQFAVIEQSRDYPNRGDSTQVRRYVEIRLDPEPSQQEAL